MQGFAGSPQSMAEKLGGGTELSAELEASSYKEAVPEGTCSSLCSGSSQHRLIGTAQRQTPPEAQQSGWHWTAVQTPQSLDVYAGQGTVKWWISVWAQTALLQNH